MTVPWRGHWPGSAASFAARNLMIYRTFRLKEKPNPFYLNNLHRPPQSDLTLRRQDRTR